jgi:hypothetical protein
MVTTTISIFLGMLFLSLIIQNSFEQDNITRNWTPEALQQQLILAQKKLQVENEDLPQGLKQLPTRSELKSTGIIFDECKINPETLKLSEGESTDCILTRETVIEAVKQYVKIYLSPQSETQNPVIKKLQKGLFDKLNEQLTQMLP